MRITTFLKSSSSDVQKPAMTKLCAYCITRRQKQTNPRLKPASFGAFSGEIESLKGSKRVWISEYPRKRQSHLQAVFMKSLKKCGGKPS